MIKVIAKQMIKEDKVETFKKLVSELMSETKKEEGCIAYQLFQDVNNSGILTFIEEWQSREALQNHMKSRHYGEIVPKLAELQEKDAEINIYTLVN